MFCYWGTSAVYTLIQLAILNRPGVQARINKNVLEDMKVTFASSKTDTEAKDLVHLLTTGQEPTKGRPEQEVLKSMKTYLKQQNRLMKK